MTPTHEDSRLLEAIEEAFADSVMPPLEEMLAFVDKGGLCEAVVMEIDELRDVVMTEEHVRSLHPELYCLSPATLRWALRHCLKYFVGHPNNGVEEYWLYLLNPRTEDVADRLMRISALSKPQLSCLMEFLKLRMKNDDVFYEDETRGALNFLETKIKST